MAVQVTASVLVETVDPSVPSIAVTLPDGRTVSRRVADRNVLKGSSRGDSIVMIYTEAMLASVEPHQQ